MEVLTDAKREADDDNPEGYYEYEPVKRLKRDNSWVREARGKAVKIIYQLLYELPEDLAYRVIFMRRSLNEVLASQRVMLQRSGQDVSAQDNKAMRRFFEDHIRKFEDWAIQQPNFQVLYLDYNRMAEEPGELCEEVSFFLEDTLDVGKMIAIYNPSLYRQREQ